MSVELGMYQTDIAMAAVKQNGLALQYVKNQTQEICLAAVQQNGLALQFSKRHGKEIKITAIRQNVLAIQYVVGYLDYETSLTAVLSDPKAIMFITDNSVRRKVLKKIGWELLYDITSYRQNEWEYDYPEGGTYLDKQREERVAKNRRDFIKLLFGKQ